MPPPKNKSKATNTNQAISIRPTQKISSTLLDDSKSVDNENDINDNTSKIQCKIADTRIGDAIIA